VNMKKNFRYLSNDGKTNIHCALWMPKTKEFTGILQISHGMVEYIERYSTFAEYLNQRGFIVVGHDHLGHGKSVISESHWGYFAEKSADEILIRDMHKMRILMQKRYPDVPYFMLGHSMGSFLLRKYLTRYPNGLRGAIIMGTGVKNNLELRTAMSLCSSMAVLKGWNYRSALLQKMVFSSNNKKFEDENNTNSWLTRDQKIVEDYTADPRCSFVFTLNGFHTLFSVIYHGNRKKNIQKLPIELPMLLISGEDDPIGAYGVGIKKLYHLYRRAGITDITYRLYKEGRHEILNELDKETVFSDIYKWLAKRIGL